MAAPVIIPELQFIDADGHPYAGGSLTTYVVGTSTPKATWVDPDGAALQTNPAILDSAGRCLMWGDGLYRLVLKDAAGNLVWDQPATTLVSAAMAPVIAAPTIADAVHLLGLDDTVTAAELASAISTEQAARIAADNALGTRIDNEVARAEAAEANLQAQISAIPGPGTPLSAQGGTAAASSGHVRVNFSPVFATVISCVASIQGSAYTAVCIELQADNAGADIYVSQTDNLPAVAPVYWIALGHY